MRSGRAAIVFGSRAGVGGLGHSCASAITAVAQSPGGIPSAEPVVAIGPGHSLPWAFGNTPPAAEWIDTPEFVPPWMFRYTWLRFRKGAAVLRQNRGLARWAARRLRAMQVRGVYLMTEVALDSLRYCRAEGIPTVLDNPNGHIRNFSDVYLREFARWCTGRYHGHPAQEMAERVEEEYALADRIRVCSRWGIESMTQFGVPAAKLKAIPQPVNLLKFRPADPESRPEQGPLRVCFVGTLDLRKGFVYLLRALKLLGPKWFDLEIVGGTVDKHSARLFHQESEGLSIRRSAGDPLPAYQRADIFVCPTLEDGVPFVLLEAMACGLPVISSAEAGAAECIADGQNGWRVPAAQVEPLAQAIETALKSRASLRDMSKAARCTIEEYAGMHRTTELSQWFHETTNR